MPTVLAVSRIGKDSDGAEPHKWRDWSYCADASWCLRNGIAAHRPCRGVPMVLASSPLDLEISQVCGHAVDPVDLIWRMVSQPDAAPHMELRKNFWIVLSHC